MEEYPYPMYPSYCQGAFYLLPLQIAEKLYKLFEEEFHRNYLWIEDVYLTGLYQKLFFYPKLSLKILRFPISFLYFQNKYLGIFCS